MNNLDLYNRYAQPPESALKAFSNGKFSGTDINPMWRIKVLTDKFGPVGFGWYTKITEHWSDTETIGGNLERVAWVRLELYIKQGGEWSAPIEGVGDGQDNAHKGFAVFRELLDKYKPQYLIHGHMHLNYGQDKTRIRQYGETTVVNATERYELTVEDRPFAVKNMGQILWKNGAPKEDDDF